MTIGSGRGGGGAVRLIGALLCMWFGSVTLAAEVADPTVEAEVERLLRHAETYYWLGMAEGGNAAAFAHGLDYLERASALAGEDDALMALRADLRAQRDMTDDTLHGVFPLLMTSHLLGFLPGGAQGAHELLDDPAVAAVTDAAGRLATLVVEKWPLLPQFDVIVTSAPARTDLEGETLFIFNASPKFFVHNSAELVAASPSGVLAALRTGMPDAATLEALYARFGVDRLLHVHIERVDVVDGIYRYALYGRLFGQAQATPEAVMTVVGIARDARDAATAAVWVAFLLLAAAVLSSLSWLRPPRTAVDFAAPVVGFLLGLLTPIAVLVLSLPLKPPPDTPVWWGWWWPLFIGVLVFVAPLLIWHNLRRHLAALAGTTAARYAGWPGYAIVAAGVLAHLMLPVFVLDDQRAPITLLLGLTAVGGAVSLMARAWDIADPLPRHGFVVGLVLIAFAGLGLFMLDLQWLMTVVVAVLGAVLLYGRTWGRARLMSPVVGDGPPILIETDAWKRLRAEYANHLPQKAAWLCLTGKRGTGKSEIAKGLVAALGSIAYQERAGFLLCDARCQAPPLGGEAFEVFRHALRNLINSDAFATVDGGPDGFDTTLSELANSIVPFANLLRTADAAIDRRETHESVALTLQRLARRSVVILFIDDVQWMDEASRDLLTYLVEVLPAGSEYRFLGIVCGTRSGFAPNSDPPWPVVVIEEPDDAQKQRILVERYRIEPATSQCLVEKVPRHDPDHAQMFSILAAVAYYGEAGMFEETSSGFLKLPTEEMKAPEVAFAALRQHIASKLPQDADERHLLMMATCLGEMFEVRVLAAAIGEDKLSLLRRLDTLADPKKLLVESSTRDGYYAFRSSHVWRAACDEYGIDRSLRGLAQTRMVIREYHATLGATLASLDPDDPSLVGRAAMQYFAAGPDYARQAAEACVRAAEVESQRFNFAGAAEFLDKAALRSPDTRGGGDIDVTWQRLRLEGHRVHVEGTPDENGDFALRLLHYVRRVDPDRTEAVVLAIRAFYDARQYRGVIALGEDLVANEAYDAVVRAEAGHFRGLARHHANEHGGVDDLRASLALLQGECKTDLHSQRLLARVADSLAQVLVGGDTRQREEARRLYLLSLRIKERPEIQDLRGQAMTHGGLGRLAFFASPPDFATARHHFERDLELSLQLRDKRGESAMHSYLGACDLSEPDYASALVHYQQALAAAEGDPLQRLYALVGLIRAADGMDDGGSLDGYGRAFCDAIAMVDPPGRLAGDFLTDLAVPLARAGWPRGREIEQRLRTAADLPDRRPSVPRRTRFRFVPMGSVAPEPVPSGELWLDVGNRIDERVLDHHQGGCDASSTAELVYSHADDLVVCPLRDTDEVVFVLHASPDLDAICAAWLADCLLERRHKEVSDLSVRQIVSAVSRHDQGFFEAPTLIREWSRIVTLRLSAVPDPLRRVRLGFGLLDRTVARLERAELLDDVAESLLTRRVAQQVAQAARMYQVDVMRATTKTLVLPTNAVEPGRREVDALFVQDPETALIRDMARADRIHATGGHGFGLLALAYGVSDCEPPRYRHIISVNPILGVNLAGLGARLEALEKAREGSLDLPLARGRERLGDGEGRHDYELLSPWYDGRGHRFTIIDSPNVTIGDREIVGSLLTPAEVWHEIEAYAATSKAFADRGKDHVLSDFDTA